MRVYRNRFIFIGQLNREANNGVDVIYKRMDHEVERELRRSLESAVK